MMLYLTGADNSLAKSEVNPQNDPNRSLGGYISSTPVPNSAMNALFDLVSSRTLEKKPKETIALGLINKFEQPVKDVEIRMVVDKETIADFKVGAVEVSSETYSMEQIPNRYQEPMLSELHDASFMRASVEFEIQRGGVKGEEIAFFPFGVTVELHSDGLHETVEAILDAFSESDKYSAKKLSENRLRFEIRDLSVVSEAVDCSYVSTESFKGEFKGEFKTEVNNTSSISEIMHPGDCVGIWLQRSIKRKAKSSDCKLLEDYKNKLELADFDEVELIVSYNLLSKEEMKNYSKDYNKEYS